MNLLGKDNETATNVLLSTGHPEGCQLCMDVMRDDKNNLPPPHFLYFTPKGERQPKINTLIAFCPRTFKMPSKKRRHPLKHILQSVQQEGGRE